MHFEINIVIVLQFNLHYSKVLQAEPYTVCNHSDFYKHGGYWFKTAKQSAAHSCTVCAICWSRGSEGCCISACRNRSLEEDVEKQENTERKCHAACHWNRGAAGSSSWPAGKRYLIGLQETVPWKGQAPRFGPLASTARLVKIRGISTFFAPIRRNRQRTRWLPKMQDFTEGTAVSFIPRVGAGDSASLKVSPALVLEVGMKVCTAARCVPWGCQLSQEPVGTTAVATACGLAALGGTQRCLRPLRPAHERTRRVSPKPTSPGGAKFETAQVDARERFSLPWDLNACNHQRRQHHGRNGYCGAGGVWGRDGDSLPGGKTGRFPPSLAELQGTGRGDSAAAPQPRPGSPP